MDLDSIVVAPLDVGEEVVEGIREEEEEAEVEEGVEGNGNLVVLMLWLLGSLCNTMLKRVPVGWGVVSLIVLHVSHASYL